MSNPKMLLTHIRKNATLLAVLFFTIFNTATAQVDEAAVKEGKALFKSNCASCHNPTADGTGPALKGVSGRWEAAGEFKGKSGKVWLHEWIKNFNAPVGAGYEYAVNMANSRPTAMSTFPTLADGDIDKILLYVDNSTVGAEKKVDNTATTDAPKEESNAPLYAFAGLLVLLVGILIIVTRRMDDALAAKEGKTIERTSFWKTRKFKAFAILVLTFGFFFLVVQGIVGLGRQQGYQPAQPIKYDHSLHAGKHKIDCQFCHTAAARGKQAGIPSLNTCMNCHKQISSGPTYGTTEIQKIYDAVGWDPDQKKYVRPAKPVEWVRIHNLPDHVYFNHSQHVVAGKVACQTCHGPIETMQEVRQFAPLSMGWCVNCHRQTEVQFTANNYYSTYEKLHKDLKDKKIDKVTVETIGGTECAKCHY